MLSIILLFFFFPFIFFLLFFLFSFVLIFFLFIMFVLSFFSFLLKSISWRWGVSIPLPLACEANALPYELHPLIFFLFLLYFTFILLFIFGKNASGGVRTHASLDIRSWDGPLRPLGHECFLVTTFFVTTCSRLLLFSFFDFPFFFYDFFFTKNASGGVRTHASLDSRA